MKNPSTLSFSNANEVKVHMKRNNFCESLYKKITFKLMVKEFMKETLLRRLTNVGSWPSNQTYFVPRLSQKIFKK
jgi:hypothetical protein